MSRRFAPQGKDRRDLDPGAALYQRMKFLLCLLSALLPAAIPAAESLNNSSSTYRQATNIVYGETHATGLLMDIFTPREKTNGLRTWMSSAEQTTPTGAGFVTIPSRRSIRSSARAVIPCSRFAPDQSPATQAWICSLT
jgi:hypothetical protein